MGGTYSTHEKNEKYIQNFIGKSEGKNHSEDLGVDGKKILEWMLGKYGEKV
jgi:hypothetical protein